MTIHAKRISDAGKHLQVHWEAAALAELERGFSAKVSRSRRRAQLLKTTGFGIGVLIVAALLIGLRTFSFGSAATKSVTKVEPAGPKPVLLSDGSELTPSAGADWLQRATEGDGSRRVELEVLHGRLRLSVVPHQPGDFKVRVGDVLVEVIGTVLSVERNASSVSVSVEHGRVRVTHGVEPSTYLSAGDRRTFTSEDATTSSSAPAAEAPREQAPTAPSSTRRAEQVGTEASWQALARDGDYAAAYGKLRLEAVKDTPGDLLLAADVARLSGHPAQAVAPLSQVAKQHATDPRAPLAAFTLGRVYLEDLGNPRDAALAFRLTRNLQHGGPMAESALAREVEALARAGETQKAKSLAQEYLSNYPTGNERKLVRHYAEEQ